MEKLLEANVELATESKKLLEEQRDWRAERAGLMKANREFVEEVERLYAVEEGLETESRVAREEKVSAEEAWKDKLTKAEEERAKLESNVEQLVQSVKILTFDNDRLLTEREAEQSQASKTSQELKDEYDDKILKQQATISNLEAQVSSEAEEREKLELELESLANELEKKTAREN